MQVELNEVATLEATIAEDIIFGSRFLSNEGVKVPGGWFWRSLAETPTGTRVRVTIDVIEEA